MLNESGDLLEQISARIKACEWHDWGLPKKKSLLEPIVGKEDVDTLYKIHKNDSRQANVHVRDLLRGPLKSADMDLRLKAMIWVIYDWGKVRKAKSEKHKQWPSTFENYQPEVIEDFIARNRKDRIASWSKVLAFADQTRYAIYDARVAMSLNAILDDVGYRYRFDVPPPSSDLLKPMFSHIKRHAKAVRTGKRPVYMNYFDYMELLHGMVAKGKAESVLDVEMRLFAYGELYANIYAEKHGLEIPYPELNHPKPTN